ncbi:hypothetical protein C8Q76DRAFT_793613 [Earliella scabrosa]|nr:hypothetical protein C8Q76DRAFT_793613 [Earliella scabrosa]
MIVAAAETQTAQSATPDGAGAFADGHQPCATFPPPVPYVFSAPDDAFELPGRNLICTAGGILPSCASDGIAGWDVGDVLNHRDTVDPSPDVVHGHMWPSPACVMSPYSEPIPVSSYSSLLDACPSQYQPVSSMETLHSHFGDGPGSYSMQGGDAAWAAAVDCEWSQYPALESSAEGSASIGSAGHPTPPWFRSSPRCSSAQTVPVHPTASTGSISSVEDADDATRRASAGPSTSIDDRSQASTGTDGVPTGTSSMGNTSIARRMSKTHSKGHPPSKRIVTVRKKQFQFNSTAVGFATTDPDEINTHVKKRTFLEGLEEYVEWLEDQIRLAGHVPVTMYRVPTYPVREFRTQSIRAILIQKQRCLRELHLRKQRLELEYDRLERLVPTGLEIE